MGLCGNMNGCLGVSPVLLICGWAGTLGNSFLEEVVKIESETKKDLAAANSIALQTEVANYSKLH